MSLFPAYSNEYGTPLTTYETADDNKVDNAEEWLRNSSFQAKITTQKSIIDITSESSNDESVEATTSKEEQKLPPKNTSLDSDLNLADSYKQSKHLKKRKREKKKYKTNKAKDKLKYEREVENVYFEDKFRDRGNCNVNTLCSRARSYYDPVNRCLGFVSFRKPKKYTFQRYYIANIDSEDKLKAKDTIIKRNSVKNVHMEKESEMPDWCVNSEEELRCRTREFNEKLTETPDDTQLWLQYVQFQDVLAKFQRYRTIKDNHITVCQRKLSIINKALEKNSTSKELLKMKLSLMGELLPADQFSNEVESLVNKDTGNIVLWQVLIMATQASVAMCTVPKVLNLYSKCFSILRQRSRVNPHTYDKRMLEMLYQCLTFLRHAGLWEQMWETLRLNLRLNLSLTKDSLHFQRSIDEKKLIDMEEVILTSRLPLNQLWLRVESLRESCHWISVSSDQLELVGDSRRFVLPEDVADYVHPMVSYDSNFRLAVYSLLALKVPLLPTRDFTLKDLALKEFDWSADSLEVLLPLAYPSVGVMAGHKQRYALLDGVLEDQLTSGPQYLRFHPAQEPYLDFIRDTFKVIAENLSSHTQRTSIYVWWLRFERLLIFLNKNDPLKNDNRGKKLKTILKEFLKKDENRNNLHFYREYALIEREMGRFESCINILETAIQSQSDCPASISNVEEKAAIFSVYRVLLETLLDVETYQELHRDRIFKIISQLITGPEETRLELVEKYLSNYIEEFLQELPSEEMEDTYFLPNLTCDVITCYVYFLYVKKYDVNEIIAIFTSCLEHCKENPHLQERLYESEIAFLQLYCEQNQSSHIILKEASNRALNLYPDNFYILSVFATIESELPSWKFNNRSHDMRPWRAMAMCLANRARINSLQKLGLTDTANATLNKLLSFYRTLARISETRHCPLIWRLYMFLLREHDLRERKGEEVYHEGVAQCPWARGVYIDAAEVAPQLLTQIQDVIREKELRMHVTPEELDILRG